MASILPAVFVMWTTSTGLSARHDIGFDNSHACGVTNNSLRPHDGLMPHDGLDGCRDNGSMLTMAAGHSVRPTLIALYSCSTSPGLHSSFDSPRLVMQHRLDRMASSLSEGSGAYSAQDVRCTKEHFVPGLTFEDPPPAVFARL